MGILHTKGTESTEKTLWRITRIFCSISGSTATQTVSFQEFTSVLFKEQIICPWKHALWRWRSDSCFDCRFAIWIFLGHSFAFFSLSFSLNKLAIVPAILFSFRSCFSWRLQASWGSTEVSLAKDGGDTQVAILWQDITQKKDIT